MDASELHAGFLVLVRVPAASLTFYDTLNHFAHSANKHALP